MKAGFVSLIGKPNAGKSTLTNTIVGEKVSIVSWKPQTTRNKILGIANGEDYQLVIVDTPGVHNAKNALSKYMMKSVEKGQEGVEVVVYVMAADKRIDDKDIEYITKFAKGKLPLIVALNKCDDVDPTVIPEKITQLKDIDGVDSIIPISALTGKNVDMLISRLLELMPEGERFFDEDSYTDKSMRFMVSEIVREKALRNLDAEIPYGIGVSVNKFEYKENGVVNIDADVVCEKQSHKAMVIGKGGAMIKKISTQARQDIEELVDGKVFLTLYVRVKEDWRESDFLLNQLGYDIKDLR
ncbi:MAG: GTPase Era [Clostridia bacterium]|nr:GTPase Era [Clostridia bacterium]MDE7329331.1 GTPase Era [Clostridia bacterium]